MSDSAIPLAGFQVSIDGRFWVSTEVDPAGNQVDPLFLTPSVARGPRRIQLALRLTW